MRLTTRLGLGLLIVGCAVLIVTSGAFETATVHREAQLGTATDDSALLGITYPSGRPVELQSGDSDSFLACLFGECYYQDREVFTFEDNTPQSDLDLTITSNTGSDANLAIVDVTQDQSGPGLARITTSVTCDTSGGFAYDQYQGEGWIEVDLTATTDNVTIQTTRNLTIECVPDA